VAITSTADFGRFTTNRGEGEHVLDAPVSPVEGEDAGIPGGLTDEMREAEAKRLANLPVVGKVNDPYAYHHAPRDPNDDAPDNIDDYGSMNPPRHDRWAAENTGFAPDRVVPSGPTNANPSFADYDVAVQSEPGKAKDSEITYERPAIVAGEGAWATRPTTDEATGVSSPIGDQHNDAFDNRAADTYDEAIALAASHGGTIADYGNPPIEVSNEGSEPPQEEEKEAGAEDDDAPPAHSATKAEWVDYVVANFEVERDEIEAMTKAEIIDTYGD
jgi:hypothetical protein